jgi:hypothetical protein
MDTESKKDQGLECAQKGMNGIYMRKSLHGISDSSSFHHGTTGIYHYEDGDRKSRASI